jgi:phosphorylcholine metabolism protein LicD
MGGDAKLIGSHADIARKMLKDITNLLDELEIPYVLEFGTLLGIIREGRLLPWDTDLDISITDDVLEKLIKNKRKIWKLGYRTRIRYFKKEIGSYKAGDIRILKIQTRKFFVFKNKGLLDIFVMKREEGGHTFVVGETPSVLKTIPLTYHDTTTTIDFDDKTYKIPKLYENYLEYIYGDWRTPKKDWDFRYEGNVEIKEVKD